MAASGTLKINVVGDASKFDRAMGNVDKKLAGLGKQVAKFGKFAAAGIGAAGAAAAAGAFKLADYANEVDRAARESGMAAEKIQVTAQALERLGVDRERAVDGMRELNLRLGEAATEGGDAAEGFKTLGIKMRDAEGNIRSSGAVMDEVMAKLGNMPNQADRAAAAAKIFGDEAGFAFAGVASEGDKLEKSMDDIRGSSSVMSEEAIDSAQKFEKSFTKMKNAALSTLTDALTPLVTWLGSTAMPFLAERVIPAIQRFGEWLGPRLSAAGEVAQRFFREKLMPAFESLVDWWERNGPTIKGWVVDVKDAVVDFGKDVQTWWNDNVSPALDAFKTAIDENWPDIKRAGESLQDMIKELGRLAATIIGSVMPSEIGDGTAKSEEDFEGMGDAIDRLATNVETATSAIATAARGMRSTWHLVVGAATSDFEQMTKGIDDATEGKFSQTMDKMKGFVRDAASFISDKIDDVVGWFDDLPGRISDALGNLGSKIADKFSFDLPGISFSGSGDGPGFGVPSGGAGGSAADRARQAARGLPIVQTSGYRTPAENAAAGGSPTSYHLDKSNPATDWDGPTWALDVFAARLREMGGWRELLWRVPGHAPGDNEHVHVAHDGGTVGRDRMRNDEVMAKLRVGETVLPEGLAEMYATHVERLKGHLAELGGMRGSARSTQLERLAAHHEKLVERRQGWHEQRLERLAAHHEKLVERRQGWQEQRLGRVESFLSDLTRAHRSGHRDVLDVTDQFGDRLHSKHRRTMRRLDGLWESFLDKVQRATKNMMQDASSGFSSPSFDGPSGGSGGGPTKPAKSEKDRIRERVEALRAMRDRGVDLSGSEEQYLDKFGGGDVHVHLESKGNVRDDAQTAKLALMR